MLQYEVEYVNNTRDLIEDCHNFAQSNGWNVFGAEYQRECFTSADAESTYQKHGQATDCKDGKGEYFTMDVYRIWSFFTGSCPGTKNSFY